MSTSTFLVLECFVWSFRLYPHVVLSFSTVSYRSLIILNLFSVHLLFSLLFLRPLRAVSAIWDIWWLSLPGNYFFLSLVIVGLWAHPWWGFICGTLIKPGCKPVPPGSRENLQFLPLSACQGIITHTLVQGFWNQGCTLKCNLQQKQEAHLRSQILKGDHPRPSWDRHAISLVDVWIFSKFPLSLRVYLFKGLGFLLGCEFQLGNGWGHHLLYP